MIEECGVVGQAGDNSKVEFLDGSLWIFGVKQEKVRNAREINHS